MWPRPTTIFDRPGGISDVNATATNSATALRGRKRASALILVPLYRPAGGTFIEAARLGNIGGTDERGTGEARRDVPAVRTVDGGGRGLAFDTAREDAEGRAEGMPEDGAVLGRDVQEGNPEQLHAVMRP